MKVIKLTQGKFAIVDDSDHVGLSKYKWYAAKRGYGFYAQRMKNRQIIQMHRLLTGALKGQDVDHINGDTLDNRRENLRIVTRSQNEWNRDKQRNNSTGYKGVILSRGRYIARIRVHSKLINLGSFSDKKEAALAYNGGATKYHGEFAKLNVV